jgi:invasion protein IalB
MAKIWLRGAFLVFLALCPTLPSLASNPPAQDPAIRGVYGEWALRCDMQTGSTVEQCALVQNVYAEGKPDLQLVVVVVKAPEGGYLLRVVAPLGIILPAGLALRIDGTDIGKTGFMRCLANGCMAEVAMDDGLIGRFSTGSTALFIIFPTPSEGTGLPIPLAGFANGLARLP